MTTTDAPQRKLTPKQAKFVEFYVANGGNSLQAARAAGYSESTALARSAEFSENVGIQQAIAERQADLTQASQQVTPEWVIEKLAERAASKTSPSASVAALRTLADILGMTSGRAGELPSALTGMLEALGRGLAAGQNASLPESQRARVLEIAPSQKSSMIDESESAES